MKRIGLPEPRYEDIVMPKNTAVGIYIAALAFLVGFAFVWHINWLAVVSMIGIIIVFIIRAFNDDSEYTVTAAEVQKLEEARSAAAPALTDEARRLADQEDMSVWEFVRYVYNFGMDIIRTKKWKSW